MKAEGAAREFKEGAGPGRLWVGVLAGPAAMLLQLQTNYALVLFECGAGGRRWVLHLVSALALAVAVGGTLLSRSNFRASGAEWEDDGAGVLPRSRFMAAVGLMTGALFALVIVAQWAAIFFYDPCQR